MEKTRGKELRSFFILSLIFITVLANLPALKNGFTNWDDPRLVLKNPDIRSLSASNLGKIFSTSYIGLGGYTPLVVLSYAVEYRLHRLDPRIFHTTNLVLHVLNTLLVFWLFQLLGAGIGASFIVAAIFGIHPIHVEAVAWIQGRKDLLFSFFYIGALISYVQFLRKPGGRRFYFIALGLSGLALFSKIAAVSLAPVLLLLEWRVSKRIDRKALTRSAPFWGMALIFIFLGFLTHSPATSQATAPHLSITRGLGLLFYSFAFYASKTLLPFGLHASYSVELSQNQAGLMLSLAGLAIVMTLLYLAYRRDRGAVVFGLLFFFFTLLPTLPSHLVGQPYADRYMYLPLVGILFALSTLFPTSLTQTRQPQRGMAISWVVLILVGILLGAQSWRLNGVWHDSVSLWTHVLRIDPKNVMAYLNRAEARVSDKSYGEAMSDYDQAQGLTPENPNIPMSRGAVYFLREEYAKALIEYDKSIALDPHFFEGFMSRGVLRARLKQFDKALEDFTAAVNLKATAYSGHYYRGLAFKELAMYDSALQELEIAYRISPTEQCRAQIAAVSAEKNR